MRSFVPFRLAAQLCVYAAVLCLFAPFRTDWLMLALIPVLAMAAAFAAPCCKFAGLRLLLGLAPLLALPLASCWQSALVGAVAAAYTAVTLGTDRARLEQWQYRREAVLLGVVSAVVIFIVALGSFPGIPALSFSAACMALAFIALRALRMEGSANLAWEAANPGLFFLIAAGGAAIGALLWGIFPLVRSLAHGFGWLLSRFLALLNSLWLLLNGSPEPTGEDVYVSFTVFPPTTEMEESGGTGYMIPPTELSPGQQVTDPNIPWAGLLGAFLGIALLILVFCLLRQGRKPTLYRKSKPQNLEAPEAGFARRRDRQRRRRTANTNRQKLRAIYREYLAFLRINGISRRASDTTSDVTESTKNLLVESDELLRALYRKARYSSEEITPEDLRLAQSCLDKLIAKENLQSEKK